MTKANSSHSSTKARARSVARAGVDVRNRVRELTVSALRDGDLTGRDISGLVNDVLEGAAAGLDASVPSSHSSVLRQVFDGLNDAAGTMSKTGQSSVRGLRSRGKTLLEHDLPSARRHVVSASAELLDAVGKFAGRVSGEMGEELNRLVSRARREAPRVAASTGRAAAAADGRVMELGGEAATAGVEVARRAVGGLVRAASGLLEGIAESMAPPQRRAQAARPRASSAPGKRASPRPSRPSKKRSTKKKVGTKRVLKRKTGRKAS